MGYLLTIAGHDPVHGAGITADDYISNNNDVSQRSIGNVSSDHVSS